MGKRRGHGTIYFVGGEESGPIKIGYTEREVGKRLACLQTGNPRPLSVLAAFEYRDAAAEPAIHNLLAACRVQGEWFDRDAALAVMQIWQTRGSRFPPHDLDTYDQLETVAGAIEETLLDGFTPKGEAEKTLASASRHWRYLAMCILRATRIDLPCVHLPAPLKPWLSTQLERDDHMGDLAREYATHPTMPTAGDLPATLRWFERTNASSGAVRAAADAWTMCLVRVMDCLHADEFRPCL